MIKYARLRERCLRPDELAEPPAAAWDELALFEARAPFRSPERNKFHTEEQRKTEERRENNPLALSVYSVPLYEM